MATLKSVLIAAALVAGAASMALAQNGPPTGGNAPVAGGAGNAAPSTGKSTTSGKTAAHKTTKPKKKNKM